VPVSGVVGVSFLDHAVGDHAAWPDRIDGSMIG